LAEVLPAAAGQFSMAADNQGIDASWLQGLSDWAA
jgi:hypothetical protein